MRRTLNEKELWYTVYQCPIGTFIKRTVLSGVLGFYLKTDYRKTINCNEIPFMSI